MAQQNLVYKLEVKWDFSSWTDETSYLISAEGVIAMNAPGSSTSGRGTMNSMTLVLDNRSNRYSPLNSASALYSATQDGKAYHAPVRLMIRTDGGTITVADHTQFVGVLKLPIEQGRTASSASTVTLRCVSREDLLMQTRTSTLLSELVAANDGGYDESYIIDQFLDRVESEVSIIADGTDYVSQADAGGTKTLDPGLFIIPWAWLDDESPIEDIWQLAAACGGWFFNDPTDGLFYYWNATHLLTASRSASSQETFDETSLKNFAASYDDREMYNEVSVEYSDRAPGATDTLWQPPDPIIVPADSSITYTATLQQPAYTIDSVNYTATTGGGVDISSDVTVATGGGSYKAQRVVMTITNANTTYAAIMRQFSITGQPLDGRPTAEVKKTSTSDGNNASWWSGRGTRTRSIRSNPYIQTRAQANMLASFLLNRQEYPGLKYTGEALGVIDRYVGDRVTLDFDGVMDSSRTGIITTIRFRLSASGYTHIIEAIDTEHLYPYIDGTYGYFVINTSELGATDPQRARLFF